MRRRMEGLLTRSSLEELGGFLGFCCSNCKGVFAGGLVVHTDRMVAVWRMSVTGNIDLFTRKKNHVFHMNLFVDPDGSRPGRGWGPRQWAAVSPTVRPLAQAPAPTLLPRPAPPSHLD